VAVSPFRALAAVHVQSTWNRLRKRSGLAGLPATIVLVTFFVLTLLVPLYGSIGVLAWVLGRGLATGDSPMAPTFGAIGFTFLAGVVGAFGGLNSGSRQLPWETLRGFPTRPSTLFRAELFAGLGEAVTMVEIGALLLVCAVAAAKAPLASPLLAVLFLTHALTLLSVQLVVGSIAQRLSRRFWGMLVLLPLAALSMPWIAHTLATNTGDVSTWGPLLLGATAWLPARLPLDAARDLYAGTATPGQLALAVLVPIGVASAITYGAFLLVSRERPLAAPTDDGKAERLWTFRSPAMGIARLQWAALVRSIPGRFGLLSTSPGQHIAIHAP